MFRDGETEHIDFRHENAYYIAAVAPIVISCLLALSLVFGATPKGAVAPYHHAEQPADPETPTEREESTARSQVSRAASKRTNKGQSSNLRPMAMSPAAVTQGGRRRILPPAYPLNSQQSLHQLLNVLRI